MRFTIAGACVACLFVSTFSLAVAQTATPSPVAPQGSTTPAATESTSTVEPPPPTMGPATATPRLPEEGGPPGGAISGFLYLDSDGSRSRTAGDGGIQGSVVVVDQIDDAGVPIIGEGVTSDASGYWERRALPDGRYRVSWEPPIPPELYSQTIPPAETVVVNPNLTIQRVTRIVEIRGANRVTGVDFGIPRQEPRTGGGQPAPAPVRLPDTGSGSDLRDAGTWALTAAIIVGIAGSAVLAMRRRTQ